MLKTGLPHELSKIARSERKENAFAPEQVRV